MSISSTYQDANDLASNPIMRNMASEAIKATSQDLAYQWGSRLATRAIPGVGTALLVYDAAYYTNEGLNYGFKYFAGYDWKDTRIGNAVNEGLGTINKTARSGVGQVIDGAAGLVAATGATNAGKTISSWGRWLILGEDGKPAAPEAIKENPIFRRGSWRTADADSLPQIDPSPPNQRNSAILDRAANGTKSDGPRLDALQALDRAGPAGALPNEDKAIAAQTRIASNPLIDRGPAAMREAPNARIFKRNRSAEPEMGD